MKHLLRRIALLTLGLLPAYAWMSAQVVSGVVKDANNQPIPGVAVFVDGTTLGVSTDLDGAYSIDVPDAAGKTLVFSCIGMKTENVPVGNRSVIDVVLFEDSNFLDETVVIGYATVKRRDLMGSVSSVSSDKLTEQPVTSVSQALSGKMAGVSVTTTEGDPDADIKVRVRGGGSITQDNAPLYIVDGFPCESINDISASEIASIDVLKDAFSTAIYGSRGANGVVIVTTKGGEKGRKISVSLNAYYGIKKMANAGAIKAMDSENFVKFQYELASVRDKVSDEYEPYFGTFADIDLYKGLETNDWVGMVFGNMGSNYSVDATISGGGENYNWTLGYARLGDTAIMSGSNYSRDNLNFKAQYKPHKKLTFDVNVRFSNTNVRGAGANGVKDTGTTSGNGRLKHAVSYAPIPVSTSVQGIDDEADYGDNAPPLLSVADNDSRRVRRQWVANAAFTWEIIDNLRLKIDGGYEDYRQTDDRFYGLTTYYVANNSTVRNTPSNQHTELFRTKIRNTNTLNYDFAKVINNDNFSLNLLVGEELTITKSNNLINMIDGFPLFYGAQMAWNFMSSGTSANASNVYSQNDNMLSFFGRVNYEMFHRYSISATVRADGSSKFAKGNRWGIFPSAAVSWKVSAEPWMSWTNGWLDELKIRYSFGSAGNNNIPTGQINKVYSTPEATNTSRGWLSMTDNYWMAGKIMNNPDLKWETTYTHNLGADFSFFNGRLSGSIEGYQNITRDLLINFPIAGSGYDSQYRNVGSTRNRGIEITLNVPFIRTKNVDFGIDANFAVNRNRVIDLGGLDKITTGSYWASTEIDYDYVIQQWHRMGEMYGFVSDGRYEASDFSYTNGKWVLNDGVVDCSDVIGASYMMPGAMKLKDLDGDGKVTKEKDRQVIGNAIPDITGGFSLHGFFYGVDIAANFNYVVGNQIYNANKIEFTSSRKFKNRNLLNTMNVDSRWTNIDWATGELITDPAVLAEVNAGTTMWSPCMQNAVFSDWAVEDGSFLRLQSATIGYTFPEKWMSKAYIRKLRIYATGTNLFCITKYSGYDPEVDTRRATPLTPGVDYSAYPKSIGCVFGVNLTF